MYRNEGKPNDRIVSIPYLAQAVVAILRGQPDFSRAGPSTLIKLDDQYRHIFSLDYPIELFLVCARAMKTIDRILVQLDISTPIEEKRNFRFHVATVAAWTNAGNRQFGPNKVLELGLDNLDEAGVMYSLEHVMWAYTPHRDRGQTADVVAKSSDFVEDLAKRFVERKVLDGRQVLNKRLVETLSRICEGP